MKPIKSGDKIRFRTFNVLSADKAKCIGKVVVCTDVYDGYGTDNLVLSVGMAFCKVEEYNKYKGRYIALSRAKNSKYFLNIKDGHLKESLKHLVLSNGENIFWMKNVLNEDIV